MKKWGWIFCLAPLAAFSSVENALENGMGQAASDIKMENIQVADDLNDSIVDSQSIESKDSSDDNEVTWNFDEITKDSQKFVGDKDCCEELDISSDAVALAEPVTYDFDEENDDFSFEERDDYTVTSTARPKIVERSVTESNHKKSTLVQESKVSRPSNKTTEKKSAVKAKSNTNKKNAARSNESSSSKARGQDKTSSSRVAKKEQRQNVKQRRNALSDDQSDSDDGSDYEDSNPAPKNNGSQKPKSQPQPQPQPQQDNAGQGQKYNNKRNALSKNKSSKNAKQSVRTSKDEDRSSFRAPKQMVRETSRSEKSARSSSEDEYYDNEYQEENVRPVYKNSKRLSAKDKGLSEKKNTSSQKQNRGQQRRQSASTAKERKAPKARLSKRERDNEDDYRESRARNQARPHSGKRPSSR